MPSATVLLLLPLPTLLLPLLLLGVPLSSVLPQLRAVRDKLLKSISPWRLWFQQARLALPGVVTSTVVRIPEATGVT